MNGDITLEARWHWRSAAEVISTFIIFAVLDVSFRRYKLSINYSFLHYNNKQQPPQTYIYF